MLRHVLGTSANPDALPDDIQTALLNECPAEAGQPAAVLMLLLVATTLSVYKPRRMTRYGQRKQHEQRALSQRQPATVQLQLQRMRKAPSG